MSDFITRDECVKKQDKMAQDIEDIKNNVNDIKISIATLPEKIIDKGDQRYAGKRVERMVDWIVRILIAAFLSALFGLVLLTK